jgi:hypothetical protein
MGDFTIIQGHRYSATINLSWAESWGSDNQVAAVFAKAGFADVVVTGTGSTRQGEGTWSGPTMTGPLDPHLSDVKDLSA